MATPTSACASAGASLVPSPVIATSLPLASARRLMRLHLHPRAWPRRGSRRRRPPSGDGRRGARVVARDHDRADAHGAEAGEALLRYRSSPRPSGSTMPEHAPDRPRPRAACRPSVTDLRGLCADVVGRRSAQRLDTDVREDRRRPRPSGSDRPARSIAAHARLRGERDERGIAPAACARTPCFSIDEHHDRSALGCLVG